MHSIMMIENYIYIYMDFKLFYWEFPSFLILAAPPVQTAGRGRTQRRRGAHSICKLISEMCAGFLISKF